MQRQNWVTRWLCSHGRHKLRAIRNQHNVGYCERCGRIYVMRTGKPMEYRVPRA